MYATFALIALISFVFSLVALLDVRWISIPRDPLLGIQSNWGLFRMCISSSGKSGTTSCQLFPSPDCSVPTDPSRDFTPCQAWIVARWVYLVRIVFRPTQTIASGHLHWNRSSVSSGFRRLNPRAKTYRRPSHLRVSDIRYLLHVSCLWASCRFRLHSKRLFRNSQKRCPFPDLWRGIWRCLHVCVLQCLGNRYTARPLTA